MKRRSLLLATALLATATALHAQTAPIRILVGAPAGGTTDTMARTLATELGKILGRIVVVENRPGAGGNIAADAVAKAAPDGNTLLMSFPGKMNPELARRISDAARQAIATPDLQRRIAHEGATPVGNSPDEFARFVHAEIQRWAKVVKYSGAKPE